MDRVFSVDDIADQFWPSPSPEGDHHHPHPSSNPSSMNRSMSEWAFQRYLQEAASSAPPPDSSSPHHPSSSFSQTQTQTSQGVEIKDRDQPTSKNCPPEVPIDSEEYQAYLKSRLNLACAAVALTRASSLRPQDLSDNASQASSTTQLRSQGPKVSALDSSKRQDAGGPVGIPSLPVMPKKSAVQVKSNTSGSSRDQSDDDEVDGKTETTQDMDPADAKRVRRILSNRESARRSRRRKQAHLTELETQVSQLRMENSSLMKRLTDISQKYNEAAVDNRVLKADVETLRAKVKMAEEKVKRVTGLNPLFQAMSEISTMAITSFACSPSDTSADAAVPVQENSNQHAYQNCVGDLLTQDNVHNNSTAVAASKTEAGMHRMGRTASMQRVASLEHLQKRIRGDAESSSGAQRIGEQ